MSDLVYIRDERVVAYIEGLKARIEALEKALRGTGVCMTCVFGAPDTFGCADCLNTGWDGGAPAGFVEAHGAANSIEALEKALREIKQLALSCKPAETPAALAHMVRICIDAALAPEQDK